MKRKGPGKGKSSTPSHSPTSTSVDYDAIFRRLASELHIPPHLAKRLTLSRAIVLLKAPEDHEEDGLEITGPEDWQRLLDGLKSESE